MKNRDKLYPAEVAMLLCLCIFLLSGVFSNARQSSLADKVIRLHIIAVSDSDADQETKLRVRDAVLERMNTALEGAADTGEAVGRIRAMLPELEQLSRQVSGEKTVKATLGEEAYPTREYETFSLPAGSYTSLRITLGEGQGHNWWCVVYPPLCTQSVTEAAEVSALTEDELALITGEGGEYEIRFRLAEWWGALTARWG